MQLENPLVDIGSIAPAGRPSLGFDAQTRLRIGVSGADGSSSLAYHATVPAGAARAAHLNRNCDEILIYLQGEGVVTQGEGAERVRAGHCQYVPRGVVSSFQNTSGADAVIVGFLPGAADLAAAGCEAAPERAGAKPGRPIVQGALVHLDDVAPAAMNKDLGWLITDFRLPIGRHNGASTTLFRARFFPDAVHKKHRHDNCQEIYYVIAGSGVAGAGRDRVRVHGGHFHMVPKGVEHWLSNLSKTDPIEVVGVYLGAGTVEETGYVYMGEVAAEDVRLPPG